MINLRNIANQKATLFIIDIFLNQECKDSESFEQFVTELRTLIKDCGYPEGIQNEQIRDHIVFGVRSSKIREKIIMEGSTLTLENVLTLRTHMN